MALSVGFRSRNGSLVVATFKPAISLLIAAGALVGCANHKSENVWVSPAPSSSTQAGLLVAAPAGVDGKALVGSLLQTKGTQGRILSETAGLFEVHGVSAEEVQAALPGAVVEPNQYQQFLIPRPSITQSVSFTQIMSEGAPGFDRCLRAIESPVAVLSIEKGAEAQQGVVLRGKTIALNGDRSQANPKFPGQLRSAWILVPPEASQLPRELVIGKRFEFTPDALGGYQLGLVVQDSRGVCDLKALRFVVTANEEFKTPADKPAASPAERDPFFHLRLVQAQRAWARSTGRGVTVAVIDTGLHYNHPDIGGRVLLNRKEIPANGIDDDNNGYVDDHLGWDFVNNDAFPYDDEGHGTHVSGLIASTLGGVAPDAEILAIKAMNGFGGGDIGSMAAAITYAADRGAQLINCSFGGQAREFVILRRAIDYAATKGTVLVAAAGNGDRSGIGFNIDRMPVYPASFDAPNLIAVAAVDEAGKLTRYSNFGAQSVLVATPGGSGDRSLLSLAYENPKREAYARMSGTSMAAPVAAGLLALRLSLGVTSSADLKAQLERTGQPSPELRGKVKSGRLLTAPTLLGLEPSPETPPEQLELFPRGWGV